MHYVLKLFDTNSNLIVEGIYSNKIKAENKADYYMRFYRDRIKFYDIDTVALDSTIVDEDLLETLYS